jgi:hypothetical protein
MVNPYRVAEGTVWAGIDYDTHSVHIVRLPELGMPTYHPCELEGDDAFERTRNVSSALPGSGFWENVTAVGIEEPGGKYVIGKLKAIQGAIITSLPDDLLVAPYHAGKWRVLAGLPGQSSKDEIRAWVYGRLGENPGWPQDACDAYCLAYVISQQVEAFAD